ncbi:signal transduction histidine kinase [Actinophytocola oryzae]|uniref:histidine kinase n=1 Tax=Actinophytocola oryzae TaxID=502181 RepID=A0A4R7VCM5_9PSEU|nr:signal transduction histidine kinase [Actinophytocola oryzae]
MSAAAGFAGALALQAVAVAGSWGGHYWVFGCAAGAVVCGLALLRRRGWAAGAGLAVAAGAVLVTRFAHLPVEPSPAMALGLAVLVAAEVRVRPLPRAGAVVAGGFAVLLAGWLAAPGVLPAVPTLNVLGWVGAVACGLGLRLLDARGEAAAEAVRHDERLALARELHDVVAHHVTGIVLHAQAARRRSPPDLAESLAGIETASTDALTAMRRVVGVLRDTRDAPVAARFEPLTELVARFDGPSVRLRLPDGEDGWSNEVRGTVYRIVQESLTNVARHAPRARSVTVDVTQDGQAVTVDVVDDGPPGRPHRGGYGLVGMRERVEALGGALVAGPRPGHGWAVRATLPLRESR